MDLNKLSTPDLQALLDDNLQAVSSEGLNYLLQASAPQLSPEEIQQRQGFGAAFGAGWDQFKTSGMRGLGEMFGSDAMVQRARQQQILQQTDPSFIPTEQEDVEQAFERGVMPGVGAWTQKNITELLGGMAGRVAAPAAAGIGAAVAAKPLGLGALGAAVLTGGTIATTEYATLFGETIERMEAEGQPLDRERAATFAAGQAVLAGLVFPGVGVLPQRLQKIFKSKSDRVVQDVLAGKLSKEAGRKQLDGTLKTMIRETAVAGGAATAVGTGIEMLQRAAAEQDLFNDDAFDAYLEMGKAGLLFGPALGVPLGAVRARGSRRALEQAGAQRAEIDARAQRAQEDLAAQQAELQERGLLFSPEEMGGEVVGPPARPDVADTAAPPAFTQFELQQKQQTLNQRLDDLRSRIEQATEARDFNAVTELTAQARTLRDELKATTEQLEQAGGPIRSTQDLEKQFNSQVRALQKAASEGDTVRVEALNARVRETQQQLDQARQAAEPDDLFARADRREAEGRARVDEELAQQTDDFRQMTERARDASDETLVRLEEEMSQMADVLRKTADENLVARMEEILQRATETNAVRFARTADDRSQSQVLKNQEEIDAIKRQMNEATAAGDVTPIPALRNRLAELIVEKGTSRPKHLISRAIDDQLSAVETIRSSVENIAEGTVLGPQARNIDMASATPEGLRQQAQDAVDAYTEAAVREMNAVRRDNNRVPLTTEEATALSNRLRDRLERAIDQRQTGALRIKEDGTSPIDRQLQRIKDGFAEGPALRRRGPEQLRQTFEQDPAAQAVRQQEQVQQAAEQLPLLQQRLEAVRNQVDPDPNVIRQLEAEIQRLTPIAQQMPTNQAQRVAALEAQLNAVRQQTRPDENVIRQLESELERARRGEGLEPVTTRATEDMGVPSEGRQGQLFTDRDMQVATTRATPQNFMRFLRSGTVQRLRQQADEANKTLTDLNKDLKAAQSRPRKTDTEIDELLDRQRRFVEEISFADRSAQNLRANAQQLWNAPGVVRARLRKAEKALRAAKKEGNQANIANAETGVAQLRETLAAVNREATQRMRQIDALHKRANDLLEANLKFEKAILRDLERRAAKEMVRKARAQVGRNETLLKQQRDAQSGARRAAEQAMLVSREGADRPRTRRRIVESKYVIAGEDVVVRRKETREIEPKSREDIDAQQREYQQRAAQEIQDKKLPKAVRETIDKIGRAENAKQELQRQYNRVNGKIATAKKKVEARKTDKGKATAREELNALYAERNSIEQNLRDTNKAIKDLNDAYEASLRTVADEKKAAGKFNPAALRASEKRLAKANQKIKNNIEKAKAEGKKQVEAAKTEKAKAAAREKAEGRVAALQRDLAINETAMGMKRQQLDRVERALLIKGDKPAREAATKPLRAAPYKGELDQKQAFNKFYDEFRDYFRGRRREDIFGADDFVGNDGTAYRIVGPEGAKISPEEATALGRQIERNVPDNINVKSVGYFSELPTNVKDQLARTDGIIEGSPIADNVRGFVLPNGDVYVIRNNHANKIDLETTYAHELIGHVSTDRLLGPEGMRKLSARIEKLPDGAKGLAKDLGILNEFNGAMLDQALSIQKMTRDGASKAQIDRALQNMEVQAARELLAYTAERRVTENMRQKLNRWYKEIIGAFRDWARRTGLAEFAKVTDADIYNVIRQATRNYNRNAVGAFRGIDGNTVFSSKPEYVPGFNPGIKNTVSNTVAQQKPFTDRVKGGALGMKLITNIVDRFAPLEYIARTSPALRDSYEGVQMMYNNRIYDQRNNMVAQIATNGAVKFTKQADGTYMYTSRGTPSLKNIFEEAGKAKGDIGNAQATLDTFGAYLAAERAAVDPKGIAEGLNKLDLSGRISVKDAEELLRFGRANENFQKARAMYRQYNDGMVDFLVETGRITPELARNMKRGDYVPYYREREGAIWDMENNVRIGDIKNQPYLKELLGGDSAIVNFEVGALQNTYMLTDMALGNNATKNTAYTLQNLGLASIRNGDGPASANVIRFYERGVQKHAVVDTKGNYLETEARLTTMRKEGKANTAEYKKLREQAENARQAEQLFGDIPADLIVRGMEGSQFVLPAAVSVMRGPANLLRKAVTRNPFYSLRLVLRESVWSWVSTGSNTKPLIDVAANLRKAWGKQDPTIRSLQEQGIIGGHVFAGTNSDMRTIALQITQGRKGWEKALANADRLAIMADEAMRVSLYNGFIKKGMTPMEASLATLESQNFTKHGMSPTMRYLSTTIPFLNAQMQGLNVFIRGLSGKSLFENKLNIRESAMQRGAMIAGMTALYYAMMKDNEAYKNATTEERLRNWFIPTPLFDEPLRIPIPFEVGLVFKAIPEGVLMASSDDTKATEALNAFRRVALDGVPGGSNLFLPQGVKPAFEVATNTSFFTMRDIESIRARTERRGFRTNANTLELTKRLGEMTNVSPIMMDHLISGYTGGIGVVLLSLLNPILQDAEAPARKASQLPLAGSMFQPTDGTGIINQVYEDVQRLTQVHTTFNRMVERDPDKAMRYLDRYADDLQKARPAGMFRQQMGELNKQERLIRADRTMSAQEKRKALDEIRQIKIDMARMYRDVLRS